MITIIRHEKSAKPISSSSSLLYHHIHMLAHTYNQHMHTHTLNGSGHLLPSSRIDGVVCLSAAWLHPCVVDEVPKAPPMIIQPGVSNSRGLRGRAILQRLQDLTHRRFSSFLL